MNRAISFLLIAAFAGMSVTARAADPPAAAPSPAAAPQSSELPAYPDVSTPHTVAVNGKTIEYTARAGTIALRDKDNQITARVFYTAYTVDGTNPLTQPVTFIYNGGPGSSTMWLRMGSFGPVRVHAADATASGPPPYTVANNPDTLLDKSDLVFIDMPDSGFGRIAPGKEKDYFGVDQDIAAFGQFITNYVSEFNRWNSPKFIFGESYGTTRSAGLADWLLDHGVALNGVILQSSILNFGLDYGNGDPIGGGDWPYVLYLPTEAATAWYHNKVPNRPADVATFVQQSREFALGEYLDALYRGDKISNGERDDIVRKLSYFLGLSQQFIRNSNVRVSYDRFQRELLRSQGVVVGRLDSRYQTYDLDRASTTGPDWDPTDSSIDAPYTTAVNAYIRGDLKYNPPMPYRANIYEIIGDSWDNSHNGQYPTNVAPDLADAMTQNPRLHVFSANGYYDFATPFFATEYTLRHLNLNPALQSNITYGFYDAGHMIYLSDSALAQYKRDLAHFYDSALGH
ncbi:MAG: peptidase S10 [Candidatus Eremiobacteraeota bacterium]|nr:peptidase S10 [Candidatus Eremiobacteraeota bacterium]